MSSAAHRTPATDAEPAPVERAALARTVLALTQTHDAASAAYDGAEHWPADGRPSGTGESRERLAHTGERIAWMAQDAAQTALARDVGAYVRALRDAGMASRQALAALAATVRAAAAPSTGLAALDDVAHDAGRYGVEAYFGPRR